MLPEFDRSNCLRAALTNGCLLITLATTAVAQCVEPGCVVLRTFTMPAGVFGWAISEAGDVNGDGLQDLLAGAPYATNGGTNSGRAFVISTTGAPTTVLHTFTGQANDHLGWSIADAGMVGAVAVHAIAAGAPSTGTSGLPGRVQVFNATTGALVRTLTGAAANDQFGYAVGLVGDTNADGRDDLIVGAPGNDVSGANAGRAYLYSGMDGSLLRTFFGAPAGSRFGSGVDGVGDVNGDGVPDVAVTAPSAPGSNGPGRLYVFSGADGGVLWTADAAAGSFAFGEFFVAGVGDVNHDLGPDVYVGDYGHGGGAGRAYVFCGRNGSLLHQFPGLPGEGLGPGRFAGDVNGDGFADLAIGAYTSGDGAPNAGRTYIRSGRDGSILRTITSNLANEQNGFDAFGIGDINADGRLDFAVSAANANRVYVFAGTITPLSPADLNDDGVVNVADLLAVIGAWGPCIAPPAQCVTYTCWADIVPTGTVNVQDLLMVIGNWG